jgi:predicted enzyme related to lactoylglutathione lyase
MTTTAPISTHVDFVTVPVTDFEAAQVFYGETLGLPRSAYSERGYSEFETDNLTLGVLSAAMLPSGFQRNANPIALRVGDVDAARETLAARGVEFAPDRIDSGVCHMAFFTDPDGNTFMLHHRYAPRAAPSPAD